MQIFIIDDNGRHAIQNNQVANNRQGNIEEPVAADPPNGVHQRQLGSCKLNSFLSLHIFIIMASNSGHGFYLFVSILVA